MSTGTNPDFATQDLFGAIQNKDYPGWTLYAQVLTPAQAEKFKYNVLDLTKYELPHTSYSYTDDIRRDWGFDDVNKTEIGRFYLTENPTKCAPLFQRDQFMVMH